jgi:ribosome-binding factor A
MGSFRLERLGEQLREEISALILTGAIKDPRVSTFLSVNRVEVTADLAFAKVWVSSFENEHKLRHGAAGLQSAAGFIQSTLGKKLRIRQMPRLTFIADTSIKESFEMIKKINDLTGSGAPVESDTQ